MGLTGIRKLRGNNVEARDDAQIVNEIIKEINLLGNKKPDAKLYLGYNQRMAIFNLEQANLAFIKGGDTEFAGWPVIWVRKEHYVRLAS